MKFLSMKSKVLTIKTLLTSSGNSKNESRRAKSFINLILKIRFFNSSYRPFQWVWPAIEILFPPSLTSCDSFQLFFNSFITVRILRFKSSFKIYFIRKFPVCFFYCNSQSLLIIKGSTQNWVLYVCNLYSSRTVLFLSENSPSIYASKMATQ